MKVSCACFIEYDSPKDLEELDFDSLPKPVMSIGEGSNLLFTRDFPGTVLHSCINTIKYIDMGLDEVFMIVGSGVKLDDFVARACEAPYWGAENLSHIPGTVGAAAVQNVGAYGSEIKDIIAGVVCYDTVQRCKLSFKTPQCLYGYRDSFFKAPENKGRYIITSVLFRLSRSKGSQLSYKALKSRLEGVEVKTPSQVREAVTAIRMEKLPEPSVLGSAGSFFKNPVIPAAVYASSCPDAPFFDMGGGMVKVPAAWLIDSCSLKGKSCGGAEVYDRQPLVIVNRSGEASPEDVVSLERTVIETVKEKFGITLEPEVEHI